MAIASTSSQGLEIGRRALQAQQAALNITGHNIANANTPGFSRRRVELQSAVSGPDDRVGTGADAAGVTRQRSLLLDGQVRIEQQVLGRWEAAERALGRLESIFNEPAGAGSSEAGTVFNEPSGAGLSGSLSRFWNAWQDLANLPESGAARATVRQEAEFLSSTLRQLHLEVRDTHAQLNEEVVQEVKALNDKLARLAALNEQIPRSSFDGGTAGDLEDERDRLLEELSQQADIAVVQKDDGRVSVFLDGHNLVENSAVAPLEVRQRTEGELSAAQVVFTGDHRAAAIREGSLRALTEVRDQFIPGLLERLDQLALTLVREVNEVHRAGFGAKGRGGLDFFDPGTTGAADIAVDRAIADDLNNIAASGDGNIGDNSTALALSNLRNLRALGEGTSTIDGFYNTMLGEVGARSQEAQTMAENNRLFAAQIENRRQSVQGVSLNDEAAQLVLFQRAYQAAARAVSIIDNLMEVTINI